jgi:hypothetical protein
MMLLRDMTVAKKRSDLLDKVNFLFVPIFNVDAHERSTQFNRINQRGPQNMGWRTSARNQNFNRDYAKLDTPGLRAIIAVINEWQPDLYIDLHVTDGADYQYDITYGGNAAGGWSPAIGTWINHVFSPSVAGELTRYGHIPGPLIMAVNGTDMQDGYLVWSGDPRYSNGYGDLRHLATILVENHSLKPYRQRVLGTYVLLSQSMEVLASEYSALQKAVAEDQSRRPDTVTLGFVAGPARNSKEVFKGIASERDESEITGTSVVRWKGLAQDQPVPKVFIDTPGIVVKKPIAYIIPPQWADVANRVAAHGIPVEQFAESQTIEVEIYKMPEAQIAPPSPWTPNPFEGRIRIDPGEIQASTSTVTFPTGSFRFSTDHSLGELLVLLLEPESADSFFQWGFFLEIFTRTEYAEPYVMEPLARKMLDNDPALKQAFAEKLEADPDFAANPQRRLMWFYEKTPFYDQQYLVYPVARVVQ